MKTSKISMVGPKKARRSLSIDTIQPQEWPWNPDLPQTPHSWEVSSALSLWSRRWQDGASARQQGPGPKPVTTAEAMFIATPCRRWDVHSMHSCSVINCTGVGWGGVEGNVGAAAEERQPADEDQRQLKWSSWSKELSQRPPHWATETTNHTTVSA